MKIASLLFCLCTLTPALNAEVILRSIAGSGMAVPERPGVTLDGFDKVNPGAFGDVIFTAGKRQNNQTIGNVAMIWNAGSLPFTLLATNDVPPILAAPPADFLDSLGNPFDEPITNQIVNIWGKEGNIFTFDVVYRNVNVNGTKIASVGYSPWGPAFMRETATYSYGLIDETLEFVMNGTPSEPGVNKIGRAPGFGRNFEMVFERGMTVPDLEEGETMGLFSSINVKWNRSGRFATMAGIDNSTLGAFDQGLFYERRSKDGVITVARDSERHPSYPNSGLAPDGVFQNVGGFGNVPFTINDRGEIAFYAMITDPDDENATVSSLWRQEDGPEIQAIVRTGTPVTIAGYGTATFTGLSNPMLTRNGDIVYRADWKEGATFMNGLLLWQLSDETHHMLLKKGDVIDGPVAGITIDSVTSFELKIEPNGRVVSKAYVILPGGAGREAVIVQRASGVFQAVSIIGESLVMTDNTDLGIVKSADFPVNSSINGMDGKSYCFTPSGRFVLKVETIGGGEYLVAVDADFTTQEPAPEKGVAAARTESWERPTGYEEALAQEEASLAGKIAAAMDTGLAVDLRTLTGLSTGDVSSLKSTGRFSADDRGFAIGYLNARRNILTAIRLTALWDPKRAAWLLDAYRGGRILFGTNARSGPAAFAEIDSDASAEGGTEIITLHFLSTSQLSLFDPDLVQLTNSLLHEARHAFQAFPGRNSTHTAAEQATWAKNRHANELIASNEEVELVEDLIAGLLGSDAGKLSKAVLGELNGSISGAELEAAKNKLLSRLQRIRKNAQYTALCRDGYCQALQRFLDAGATSGAGDILLEELKRLKCFLLYRNTMNEFGEIGVFGGPVIYNTTTNQLESTPVIKQIDTRTGVETSFNIGGGAEVLYGCELSMDEQMLYAGVKTGTTGTIYSYSDMNADDHFDSATETMVVTSPALDGGFYLSMDPSGKGLYAYALDTGMVYRVDEIAGMLESIGQLMPSPDPVLDFQVDGDYLTISPMPRDETAAPGFALKNAYISESGIGEEIEYSKFDDLKQPPGFGKALLEGDLNVTAYGQPGSEVRLERATGMQPFESGESASFDDLGKANFTISPPLTFGERLRLVDRSSETVSSTLPVWPEPVVSDSLRALAESDRGLYLESQGTPDGDYSMQWGQSLSDWGMPVPFKMGPFGTSVQTDSSIEVSPPKYFGRLVY